MGVKEMALFPLFRFFALRRSILLLVIVSLILDFHYSFLSIIFGAIREDAKIMVLTLSFVGILLQSS